MLANKILENFPACSRLLKPAWLFFFWKFSCLLVYYILLVYSRSNFVNKSNTYCKGWLRKVVWFVKNLAKNTFYEILEVFWTNMPNFSSIYLIFLELWCFLWHVILYQIQLKLQIHWRVKANESLSSWSLTSAMHYALLTSRLCLETQNTH